MFAILAVLLDRALLGSNRKFAIIVGIGFLVGCCSEYLQSFFPGRDPAITDVIINTFGTALGAAFGLLLEQLRVLRFRERSNARPLE